MSWNNLIKDLMKDGKIVVSDFVSVVIKYNDVEYHIDRKEAFLVQRISRDGYKTKMIYYIRPNLVNRVRWFFFTKKLPC